tara:strand:+ start:333 stop:542 length:210 start_codon:yes stop_codon:yes gene_type:complete
MVKVIIVFLVVVLHNDDTVKINSKIVDVCPNQLRFTTTMNQKILDKKIQHWEATCFNVRMKKRNKGMTL